MEGDAAGRSDGCVVGRAGVCDRNVRRGEPDADEELLAGTIARVGLYQPVWIGSCEAAGRPSGNGGWMSASCVLYRMNGLGSVGSKVSAGGFKFERDVVRILAIGWLGGCMVQR